jgi:hypothetical protein
MSSSLSGAAGTNEAGYFSALGATNDYGLVVANGAVGIGTTAPKGILDVIVPSTPANSIQSAYFRSSPSAGYSNNIWIDNSDGPSNFKNQIIFSSQGSSKWSIGTDLQHGGAQNFFIYDTLGSSRVYIFNGNFGIGLTGVNSLFETYQAAAKTSSSTGILYDVFDTSSSGSINKIGLDLESTGTWNGAGATNTGLNVNATGGSTNYAAVFKGGNVGAGTTAPGATLDVMGHMANSGSSATVNTCGTSPTISGNDMRGTVKLGTGSPTACTVAFASAYATAPSCIVTPYGGFTGSVQWSVSTSTTAMILSFSATPSASQQFTYHCLQ